MNPDQFLSRVRRPSRYLGNEVNAVRKNWQAARVRLAFVFPDLYEIGMSHLGLQILYHLVNGCEDFLAERVYVPDTDMEQLLREHRQPLRSLESRRPLADFDLIGITLPYELCYTNILTVLDLAGIPFRSADRGPGQPFIVGGGPCAFHPEPVAPFFDAILLGDGEEAVLEIARCIGDGRAAAISRTEVLEKLAAIEGVYVPAFFCPEYAEDGGLAGIRPLRAGHERVRRRILPDLDAVAIAGAPLVPNTRIVHDRLGIELARGCTRGCRFCQAGVIYRPVREREPAQILRLAAEGIRQGGFEELALLSLSAGEYSCLAELLAALMDRFERERVSISMPSMRVGTLTPAIMAQIKRVRKTGFTVAPEAGTERLRRVINKGITADDLLATCNTAFGLGWRLLKFYFMIGLPTETETDVAAIAELSSRALALVGRGKRGQINVSVSTFVPKPHTPFEREPQLTVAESRARLDFLRTKLRERNLRLKWHDPEQSFLEGILCRGDRQLAALIETAWKMGARLDAWTDHFNLKRWRAAAADLGIDLDRYLRRRRPEEVLPWQHLDAGVDEAWLRAELDRAMQEAATPDCRTQGCQQCGLCDFKTVRPVLHKVTPVVGAVERLSGFEASAEPGGPETRRHFRYRISYARRQEARFLSHLELLQVFFRAFRRAGLPLNYSQGHNPTPRVSFSPALPLGTESLAEYLIVDLCEPLPGGVDLELPGGITVLGIVAAGGESATTLDSYEIRLPQTLSPVALARYHRESSFLVTQRRGDAERVLDLKNLLRNIELADDGTIRLSLLNEPGRATLKPAEIAAAVFGLDGVALAAASILKTASVFLPPDSQSSAKPLNSALSATGGP